MKKIKKISLFIVAFLLIGVLIACNGNDGNIKVYTRDTSSGTRDGFFTSIGLSDAVKSNELLAKGYIEVESNGAMVTQVKNDEHGIGYISLSSLESSGLKGLTYNSVAPTEANVINGTYKLTRNFNYMLRDEYADENVEAVAKALQAYMTSIEGIGVIQGADGIVDAAGAKAWSVIKVDHPIVDDANLNITFRVGGSTSVEKVGKALTSAFAELVAGTITFEHEHTGSSDAWKRTNGGEKDGAAALDLGFASREFKTDEGAITTGTIAIDAIVVVVNTKNSLTTVTAADLIKIFKGETSKWSELK